MHTNNFLFILLFVAIYPAIAENDIREEYGTGENLFLHIYQNYISPIKGGNTCPMHPSCSQYSKIAFFNNNPALAFVQTCDRLIRCGHDEISYSYHEETDKVYDPVQDSADQEYSARLHKIESVDTTASQFTDLLLAFNEYDLALHNCFKSLSWEDDSSQIAETLFKIGNIYLLKEDFSSFQHFYNKALTTFHLSTPQQAVLDFQLASCFYNQGYYRRSISALSTIPTDSLSLQLKDKKLYLLSLSYARLFDWKESAKFARQISAESPYRKTTEKLMIIDKHTFKGQLKSPPLAAALSTVIPGAGYAYTGRYSTAFASLLVNGLFIWASAESFNKKNYAIGSCATFVASGFYFGNILGSYKSAVKMNRATKHETIDNIINSH